ncbi:hypothetical protein HK101_011582 [Irineochytrium annulatum]|nr:hypothetical protein HK101_011582 [Irineochytrium annulatum]
MGGGHHGPKVFSRAGPYAGFVPPKVPTMWFARVMGASAWFFIFYRFYYDGGHFIGHHKWSEPKYIAYLEEIDKKYGTHYATDNMHH